MKNRISFPYHALRDFLILWSTQSLSQLGSSMTGFALTLWLYQETGSALQTAALAITTYAPYVLVSIFAGALSDRWNKKRTMLVCDAVAALSTVVMFTLYASGLLRGWHLYVLNVVSGLMNTFQRPASDVTMTLITPKEHYQRTSGLWSFSSSLITILCPMLATALYASLGMTAIVALDLFTFALAFLALLCLVKVPQPTAVTGRQESMAEAVRSGLRWLRRNPMILTLILFMAGVNLVASMFDAVLPAYVLPSPKGSEQILAWVNASAGAACLLGSLVVSMQRKPKDRLRLIYRTMLFSLTIENFVLAFTREPVLWCLAQTIGWFVVPIMSASLDVVLRTTIPVEMQGRVYACRNSLQFFTIPVGLFLGGLLVDEVFEPLMALVRADSPLTLLFGSGKGSGAAVVMLLLGLSDAAVCLIAGRHLKKYRFEEQTASAAE